MSEADAEDVLRRVVAGESAARERPALASPSLVTLAEQEPRPPRPRPATTLALERTKDAAQLLELAEVRAPSRRRDAEDHPAGARAFRPHLEMLEDRTLLNAGALDPTFGAGGIVINRLLPAGSSSLILVVQPDGKLLEQAIGAGGSGLELLRENVDGSLDSTFGQGGTAFFPTMYGLHFWPYSPPTIISSYGGTALNGSLAYTPSSMAVQPDGKILLAGSFEYEIVDGPSLHPVPPGEVVPDYLVNVFSTSQFAVIRLNSDGTLDTSFGSGGVVLTAIGSDAAPAAMVLQPDGKIIVAGSSDHQIAVVRYEANGSLDPTFGSGGVVLTSVESSAVASAVALAPDGKIVVGESTFGVFYSVGSALTVLRYDADGALDSTFGVGGVVSTSFPGSDRFPSLSFDVTAVVVEADGAVVAAGRDSLNYVELVGITSNGTLDAGFGYGGAVFTGIYAYQPPQLALESDGKLLLASADNAAVDYYTARPGDAPASSVVLARYGSDGSEDLTFGDGGRVTTTFGESRALTRKWPSLPTARSTLPRGPIWGWPWRALRTTPRLRRPQARPGVPAFPACRYRCRRRSTLAP